MTTEGLGDSSDLLCLCWNDHMENILNVFMEQLTTENLVDVTIMCEGKFIKAHKMILSACSPYLHQILTMHNVAHPVIIMNNVKFSDMKLIIEFMYCGQIKVSVAEFESLLSLAQSLQVKGLSEDYDIGGMEGIESCVESILQETSPETNKRKLEEETSTKRIVRRRKKESCEETTTEKEQSHDRDHVKNNETDPPDTDKTNPGAAVNESVNGNVEYWDKKGVQQWVEDDGKKPNKVLLKCIKNSSDSIDASPKITKNPNSVRLKNNKPNGTSSENSSPELHKNGTNSGYKGHVTNDGRIRRPPNAFMIFSNEWRKKLAKIYEFESNAGISRRLGEMWNSLKQSEKDVYFNAARLADLEHKEKYPGYHYSPQKARLRKRNQLTKKKLLQFPPVKFAKVFMMDDKNSSIPVLIALNNPESPEKTSSSVKSPKRPDEGGEKRGRKRKRVTSE